MRDLNQRQKGASKEHSKLRVLAIERMIDEGRQITIKEIQKRLEMQYDMRATAKTIRMDLMAIDRFIPIEIIHGVHGGFKKYNGLEDE